MKISLVLLTHNRIERALKTLKHNSRNCGYDLKKMSLIWVDNGSLDYIDVDRPPIFSPTTTTIILNSKNLGVAKGYNQGLSMADGDYIVITGCDRIMPAGWLGTWLNYFDAIPNTGIISCYSKPLDHISERIKGKYTLHFKSQLAYIPAIPLEARIMKRELFRKIGYFHEGLGLYGWEDVLWSERAEKVTKGLGLINYIIPGMQAEHLGDEGCNEYLGFDSKEYHEFKRKESQDHAKQIVCNEYRAAGHPYINPYV